MNYTREDIKNRINAGIQGRKDILLDFNETVNDAIRQVLADLDFKSARKKATLQPNMFSDVYRYACPTDLKEFKIISLPTQAKNITDELDLVTNREFIQEQEDSTIAFNDYNDTRQLLISMKIDDNSDVLADLDSLTSGGGTWEAYGDGTNLRRDDDNYMVGNASLRWDINADGGTTAGVKNTNLNDFDLDNEYLDGNGSLFVWAYINSTTDLTNYIAHIGSSESNYYSKTITATHEGTSFVSGWNLLRFDLTSLTETGTVDDDNIDYIAIFMTKAVGKVSESDYRFDNIVLRKGEIRDLYYYSKYGWINTSGTWLENSTDDSDYIVADTTELAIYIKKGVEIAADELDDTKLETKAVNKYNILVEKYKENNPSEALIFNSTY